MADTVRTRAQLITLFADNTTGDISEQDVRDFVMSSVMTWRGVTTQTTTYGILATDDVVLGNNDTVAFTVTLPTAVGITGKTYIIKNINAATVTVATTSSQTIDF